MDERERRIAANEGILKETNEQIEERSERFGLDVLRLVCECGGHGCRGMVEIERAKYEPIQRHPEHFMLLPNHEHPEVERVIERHAGYIVVEKFPEEAEVAEAAGEAAEDAEE